MTVWCIQANVIATVQVMSELQAKSSTKVAICLIPPFQFIHDIGRNTAPNSLQRVQEVGYGDIANLVHTQAQVIMLFHANHMQVTYDEKHCELVHLICQTTAFFYNHAIILPLL